jgi:uncharacterized protein with ParB-like and HNH nuclease domain
MNYTDIPKFTEAGHYQVSVDWESLESSIFHYTEEMKISSAQLNMHPDFQRGHVWTKKQRVAYVEYKLAGGLGVDVIYFNCPGWMNTFKGPFVLVDGLQRVTSALMFLRNELKAFGFYKKEYSGFLQSTHAQFLFNVNNLETREEVLTWYIQMNSSGTPHSKKEIDRVKELLRKEKS